MPRRSNPLFALAATALMAVPSGAAAQSLDILLNCSGCHTLGPQTGNPDLPPRFPVLNGQPARYIEQQLEAFRTGERRHRQMMLSAQALGVGGAPAMARMYAYSYRPPLVFTGDPERMDIAIALHENGAWERGLPSCASCHALDDGPGIDTSARLAPRLHGQPLGYIAKELRAYADGTRTTGPMGRMQAYAGLLTAAEIEALSAYYAAFDEETPQ